MAVSVAIIGAGGMGQTHATNLAEIAAVRLVAVADVVCESAAALAAGSGAAVYDDYRELIERAQPDGVYFCTPAIDHQEVRQPGGWNIDRAFIPILARNDAAAIRATAREAMLSLAVTLAANYSAVTGRIIDLADFITNPPDDPALLPNARPVVA